MITRAQALWAWYSATGSWPPDEGQLQGSMQSDSFDSLVHHLRAFNVKGLVTSSNGGMPEWIVRDLAPEIGTEQAGLLMVPGFAPTIIQGLGDPQGQWTPQRTLAALQATDAYKTINGQQVQWAQGNPADRERLVQDEATKVYAQLRQTYGSDYVDTHGWGADSEFVRIWATKVASGEVPESVLMFSLTTQAESVPGTPANSARIAQRQQAAQPYIDVENTAAKMGETWREWMGEQTPPPDLNDWASRVVNNVNSMADFETTVRQAAQSMYPTKPEFVSFKQWADIPRQMISSTLELPQVGDSDATLNAYLRGEIPTLADLSQKLRQDPRYDRTTTAIKDARQIGAGILSRWGFV